MTALISRFSSPLRVYFLSPIMVAFTTWGLLLIQSLISRIEGSSVIRPFGIGFLLVIALLTVMGGRGPGLMTLALSCLSLRFYLAPLGAHGSFNRPRDWAELVLLLAVGGVMVRGLEALRKNEQLLAESEEARARLRAVMDTAPVGVLLSDKAGKLVYANREAERIWGHPLEAVGREEWARYRILNTDGTPTPPEQLGLARALAGEAALIEDERIIEHPDGTRVFVQASSTLVRDDHGRVRSGLVVFSDITERKRATQEIERLLAREQLIGRIGQTSLTTLDAELVHREAIEGLHRLLTIDRCFFSLEDLDESRYAPGQIIALDDTQGETVPMAHRTAFARLGLRAAITMPLFSGGRLVKTLTVGMTETPRAWTAEEAALVEAVAIQTRAAAEAARSQQRERVIALALQDALIPAVPKRLLGLEMNFYYKPALDEAKVGGDFLDVFALQNGQVVFAVGDLSGKGLAAASQVATVRNMLRYSLYRVSRLDQAILELNNTVVANDLLTGFATLFVGIYDQTTRNLTYLSCGHDPGLVRRADSDEIELLPEGDAMSPVLGLVENGHFLQHSVTLQLGDILFFCTDGVTEAGRSRGEFLGVAGVAQMLRDGKPGENLEELIARVVSEVRTYSQGVQHDDVCLLAAAVSVPAGV